MRRIARFIGTAALSLLLTGCVAQEKYNAVRLERDGLKEELAKAQSDSASARAEADSYKSQLGQLANNGGSLQALVSNLQQQNAALQTANDDLNKRYAEAMARPAGGSNPLPAPLSDALSSFAQQNPDLVEFDASKGMVKFRSDVTFALGDATLTPKAREVITKFASILNSSAANGYELMVAGHTDNTRVVNPRTIAAGHKDNWYLSAHRAISVGTQLQQDGVNPQRITIVGHAEYMPLASNSSESGRAQNRRVEVLILPTMIRTQSIDTASSSPRRSHRPAEMNKDSTASSPSEMYNK
jgi:chemotaxis protein MotB